VERLIERLVPLGIVFGAGGAGCVARYLVNLAVGRRPFPYATLVVNVAGSFLIAFLVELALLRRDVSPHLQLALTTGFLGGFTTYSAFNLETTALILDGRAGLGVVNLAATVAGGIAAGLLGLWAARQIAL
jgi:fluoride exporter